ncbi:retrovirus-related pol polyprotein from transposon TNT 1-94 [Tanacetum coccineum]
MFSESSSGSPSESKTRHNLRRISTSEERNKIRMMELVNILSEEEPKKVSKALKHPGWVDAMQDELNQFARNKVWTLVLAPYGKTIISLKWVFRNKIDESRIVFKDKGRLVAQGYKKA